MRFVEEGAADNHHCIPGLEEEVHNFAADLILLATAMQEREPRVLRVVVWLGWVLLLWRRSAITSLVS